MISRGRDQHTRNRIWMTINFVKRICPLNIPVSLITRQEIALYQRRLPHPVLQVWHIFINKAGKIVQLCDFSRTIEGVRLSLEVLIEF